MKLARQPDWKKRGMQFTDLGSGQINLVRFVEVMDNIGYADLYCEITGSKTAALVTETESAFRDLDATAKAAVRFTNRNLIFPFATQSFDELGHHDADRAQPHDHQHIAREDGELLKASFTAGQWFREQGLLPRKVVRDLEGGVVEVLLGKADEFAKAPRIEIGFFEGGAHGVVAVEAVMTCATGNMVGHNDEIPELVIKHLGSLFCNATDNLMAQNGGLAQQSQVDF